MVADIRVDMVSNMEVDKVADKEMVDMELDMVADIDINMEIQFGERGGHKGWLIGPKLFRPKAYQYIRMCIIIQIIHTLT